jgi:hypothetical protein
MEGKEPRDGDCHHCRNGSPQHVPNPVKTVGLRYTNNRMQYIRGRIMDRIEDELI